MCACVRVHLRVYGAGSHECAQVRVCERARSKLLGDSVFALELPAETLHRSLLMASAFDSKTQYGLVACTEKRGFEQ